MAEKRAIQRVVRDSNGGLRTIYVDLDTFLEVPANALDQYRIVNTTPPPPEEVSDVNSPNEDSGPSPGDSLDLGRSQGERNDNTGRQILTEKITQRENPQGAPVGKVSRGSLGPATPSTDISRNPQDTQKSNPARTEVGTVANTGKSGTGKVQMENGNKNGRFRDIDPGLKSFMNSVADSVVPGASVHVFSGDINPEDPGWSANDYALSKSHRHTDEMGADVYFSDAKGKRITDQVAVNDIAQALAAADPLTGIGIGPGYMSPNTMHIDLSGLGGSWGKKGKKANMDPVVAGNIDFARETRMGPTPYSDAPTPYGPDSTQAFVSQDNRVIDRSGTPNSFVSQDERIQDRSTPFVSQDERWEPTGNVRNAVIGNTNNTPMGIASLTPDSTAYNRSYFGPDRVSPNDKAPIDSRFGYDPNPDKSAGIVPSSGIGGVPAEDQAIQSVLGRSPIQDKVSTVNAPKSYSTPAEAAANGMVSRTPAELSAIAMTFAGELGPDTLQGLAAGDPLAKTEFANMLTSLENRAQSKTFNGIANALQPSQYQSLMRENLPTTYDNYEKFGTVISSVMNDFYTGALQPTSWDITSYYNPSISAPPWAGAMQNPTMVTEHLFGSLPEYGPNTAFRSSNALMSNPRPDNTFESNYTRTGTPGSSSGGGWSTQSAHSLEHERDNSLAGRASGGRSSGMGTPGSSPGGGWSSQGEGGRGGSSGGYSGNSGSQDSPSEGGGRFGGSGLGSSSSSGGYSGKSSSQDSPSEGGGRFGGSGLGSTQSAHDAERERDNSL